MAKKNGKGFVNEGSDENRCRDVQSLCAWIDLDANDSNPLALTTRSRRVLIVVMLPTIASERTGCFVLTSEGIEDLFYDGLTNPDHELSLLQSVLNVNAEKVNSLYSNNGAAMFRMNRGAFRRFVYRTTLLESGPSDEIFSCSTNLYDAPDGSTTLPDCSMSTGQFATAIVRLANLWVMMNEGMEDASKLSVQTSLFLDSIISANSSK